MQHMTYESTAIIADHDVITHEMGEALYEAGCDDCSPGSSNGVVSMYCHREAADLPSAIRSVIADVQKAGYHVAQIRIDKDALVSI
jgi:hypothetical protein